MKEIKTSDPKWVIELAKCYKEKTPVMLIDDAKIGINPLEENILQMGKKAELDVQGWAGVVAALGVAAAGIYLLVMAILDPEPFSKIGLTIATAAVMTMGGGFMAVKVLTGTKPPSVKMSPTGGFEINWE